MAGTSGPRAPGVLRAAEEAAVALLQELGVRAVVGGARGDDAGAVEALEGVDQHGAVLFLEEVAADLDPVVGA